jgi:hypothetical protein
MDMTFGETDINGERRELLDIGKDFGGFPCFRKSEVTLVSANLYLDHVGY